MKIVLRIIGIIAACVGILFSLNMIKTSEEMKVPEKYVFVSSSSFAYDYDWDRNTGAKYLGGDAYNYIVEASLKAGYYNATVTTKTITGVGGTVLLFFSAFFLIFSLYSLQNCLNRGKQTAIMKASAKRDEDYQGFALQHLRQIEEYLAGNPGSYDETSNPPDGGYGVTGGDSYGAAEELAGSPGENVNDAEETPASPKEDVRVTNETPETAGEIPDSTGEAGSIPDPPAEHITDRNSVSDFLAEIEPAGSVAEIWNIWRKYNLSSDYYMAGDYIRKRKDREYLHGSQGDLPKVKKMIRELMG